MAKVNNLILKLEEPMPPVAVLTSGNTASSGEAITVAFRERPDARSFGQKTKGLSTSIRGFPLSDGAWIYLAVSKFADRTRRVYEGSIEPDVVLPVLDTGNGIPQEAIDWLLNQTSCLEER